VVAIVGMDSCDADRVEGGGGARGFGPRLPTSAPPSAELDVRPRLSRAAPSWLTPPACPFWAEEGDVGALMGGWDSASSATGGGEGTWTTVPSGEAAITICFGPGR
jgi:hypothetical protein